MKCPYCGNFEDKVVDSRLNPDGDAIRRRRECLKCERRYTTYEHIENTPLMVVKKGGNRQPFDRERLTTGVRKACEKRPVSIEKIQQLVDTVERGILKKYEKEVPSNQIGELVMKKLYSLDDVAYVRFASVYRQFKDVEQFAKELQGMLSKKK